MRELNSKISSWAITTTSMVIFFGVVLLAPLIASSSGQQKLAAAVFTGLTSIGFYKLITQGLLFLFSRILWLKKILLGDSFLEGTWVGHWVHDGKNVFTIETISQENGETVIKGRQIGDDLKTQADWTSESAYIDLRGQRLIYVYSCNVYRTNHQQNGIGLFNMIKPNKKSPPSELDGCATDTIDGVKDTNREHKISDSVVGTEEAIAKARVIFKLQA